MPIYVYKCPKCGYLKEVLKKSHMDIFQSEVCDTEGCTEMIGKQEIPTIMDRQVTTAAFHLKGCGWAKDGYGSKDK